MANGVDPKEAHTDFVNQVLGSRPMKGASWEDILAAAQYYGMRATLTAPSTVRQLKSWTDRGVPVMIGWNPEGRPWSHASVVFHVDEDLQVYVADPNIPDPDETVRILSSKDFYSKWSEDRGDYVVRRPAMAIEREITLEGRQVMASSEKGRSLVDNMIRLAYERPVFRPEFAPLLKTWGQIYKKSREVRSGSVVNLQLQRDYGSEEIDGSHSVLPSIWLNRH